MVQKNLTLEDSKVILYQDFPYNAARVKLNIIHYFDLCFFRSIATQYTELQLIYYWLRKKQNLCNVRLTKQRCRWYSGHHLSADFNFSIAKLKSTINHQ